ncbi:MAG: cysteine-rich KTR domain-containing protein [Eubacterium sp.]|nr:cysteine-rich KTR domain-containing protein [Eubacterium sp.]
MASTSNRQIYSFFCGNSLNQSQSYIKIITEWIRCPVCGNKTRLQIRAGQIQS